MRRKRESIKMRKTSVRRKIENIKMKHCKDCKTARWAKKGFIQSPLLLYKLSALSALSVLFVLLWRCIFQKHQNWQNVNTN